MGQPGEDPAPAGAEEAPSEAAAGATPSRAPSRVIREVAAWFASTRGTLTPPGPPGKVPTPRVIAGRYEILDLLGQGGMGIVYLARDRELGRNVAVKVLREGDLFEPEDAARFRLEAVATASLRHPHIVPVHDLGEYEGRPYYTMDAIEGENLASIAARGGLDPRVAAEIGRQVAEALEAGHAAGILHRDIKPQNILVRLGGEKPHAWLTDFGLAKLIGRPIAAAAAPGKSLMSLTRSGEILGTPAYMSPEQIDASGAVDARSDVYSLGATLYATLTAELPLKAPTLTALLAAVRDRDPVPPRSLNPEIDRDFETIVLKCLQKDPKHRYQRAADLCEDFRLYLLGEPIRARPVTVLERLWRKARRHRAVAVPVAALALTLVVGTGTLAALQVRRAVELRSARAQAWEAYRTHRYAEAIHFAQAARALAPEDAEVVQLEGRMRGEESAAAGEEAFARYREAQRRLADAERAKEAFEQRSTPTSEEKRRMWDLAADVREADHDRERCFELAASKFAEALSHWPQHMLAKERLGDLYWDCYVEAENEGDMGDLQAYATLVRQYAPSKYAAGLEGKADVRLALDVPAGARAEAYLFRYTLRDSPPILVPVPCDPKSGSTLASEFDPSTPFRLTAGDGHRVTLAGRGWSARLPFGSYLLWFPGRGGLVETRYPFVVERGGTWDAEVELGLAEDLPPGDWAYVPAGYFHPATESDEVVEAGGFLIGRREVTCGEYLEFLNDAEARRSGLAPQESPSGPRRDMWKADGSGRHTIPPETRDLPVTGLAWVDAEKYARWRTRRDGDGECTFRLANAREWEMAARGVDGREYPWGVQFDEEFCASGAEGEIEVTGRHAMDESPYGVLGMAGGVAEWTSTKSNVDEGRRVVKGGGWLLKEAACAASASSERQIEDRDPAVGFRLVAIPVE